VLESSIGFTCMHNDSRSLICIPWIHLQRWERSAAQYVRFFDPVLSYHTTPTYDEASLLKAWLSNHGVLQNLNTRNERRAAALCMHGAIVRENITNEVLLVAGGHGAQQQCYAFRTINEVSSSVLRLQKRLPACTILFWHMSRLKNKHDRPLSHSIYSIRPTWVL
jgi:hypothetical protein